MDRPDRIAILGKAETPGLTGTPGNWTIDLPESALDPIATVIAMDFKKAPVIDIPQPAGSD